MTDIVEGFDLLNREWQKLAPGGRVPDLADVTLVAMCKYNLLDAGVALMNISTMPDTETSH